ncbi:MAG: LysE family translocator [Pseudomonadota bacterium]
MDIEQVVAMMLFAMTSSVTPGPNNLMLMMSGNLFGWRATLPHIFGIVVGCAIMLVCAVYGLTILLDTVPWLTWSVRILGTGWLCWLGAGFLLSGLRHRSGTHKTEPLASPRPLKFYEAALFQWANPKALVVLTSAAGAFVTLAPTPLERAIVLTSGFSICALLSTHIWTLAGSGLSKLMQTGSTAQGVQIAMGLLMMLTAASLLVI